MTKRTHLSDYTITAITREIMQDALNLSGEGREIKEIAYDLGIPILQLRRYFRVCAEYGIEAFIPRDIKYGKTAA